MNFLDTCQDIESEYRIAQSIFPTKRLYTQIEKHNLAMRLKIFQTKFNKIATSIQCDKYMLKENKIYLLEMIYNISEELKRVRAIDVKTSDTLSDETEPVYVRTEGHNYDELLKQFFNKYYTGESLKELYKKIQNKEAEIIGDIPKDDLLSIMNQFIIAEYDPKKWKIMSERKIRAFYKLHHDWHISLDTLVEILNNHFYKNYTVIEIMKMSSAYFVTFGTGKWLDAVGRE